MADFRRLLITFVIQALAVGSMLARVDYLARTVLRDPAALSILFACFVGPALVATPAWQRLAERTGKKRGYQLSSVVLAVGAAGLLSAGSVPVAITYALTAVTGIGYAGGQLFGLAMLPDTAADDARRTRGNRVGVFTGVWTAGETFGLALGPAIFAGALAAGGYVSSTEGDAAQPASATTAIVVGFSIMPAVLIMLSLIPLRGYALTQEDVDHGR